MAVQASNDPHFPVSAPGNMNLVMRSAGPGSRALAAMLDHLLLGALLVSLSATGLSMPFQGLPSALPVGMLAVAWFFIPEALFGRSIGKASLELRVVREDGRALGLKGALVRNLMRIGWLVPIIYVPEVLFLIFGGRSRRLGDILAGSVVVSESTQTVVQKLPLRLAYRSESYFPLEALQRVGLEAEEYEALRVFAFRTRTLTRRDRGRLIERLMVPLAVRAGCEVPLKNAEYEELFLDLMHLQNAIDDRSPVPVAGA